MWSVLIGRFHADCAGRHCEGGGCAVCVRKGDASAYNFPLIKHHIGRSRICGQGNRCTFCRFGDFSACTNVCSTACHGYIVLNSFPNCGYGSVSSNGNLLAGSLFNTANAPSLELLTGRSSKTVCRESVFAGNAGYICHCACTAVSVKAHRVGRDSSTLWRIGSNAVGSIHDVVVCIGIKFHARIKRRTKSLVFPFDRHLTDLSQGQSVLRINAGAVHSIRSSGIGRIDRDLAGGVDGRIVLYKNTVN